jgi:lipoprotein NlpI
MYGGVAAQPLPETPTCDQQASVATVAAECAKTSAQAGSEAWSVDALTYLQRALTHLKNNDQEGAIDTLNQSINLNPHIAEAHFTRGTIYAARKEYDLALQDFDQAVELNPILTEAFQQRALVHRNRHEYAAAIKDLDAAVKLEPFNPGLLRDRGEAYLALGEYDHTVDDYQAAMMIDRNSVDPYVMANLLFFQGRFSQSAQTMQQVLKAKPADPYAMLWRYLAAAKANGAAAAAHELAELSTRTIDKRWPAAAIDYYLGRLDDNGLRAAAAISDATENIDQICQAAFYAGEAKLLKGTNDEAITLLHAATSRCEPNTPFFHGASAELKRLGVL